MINDRVRSVVENLEKTLLDFIREHRITHEEYRIATDLLIETVKAGEESLLYDVFLEAATTNVGNTGRRGSPAAIEGPFYAAGAPRSTTPAALPSREGEAGEPLLFVGRVTDLDGNGLADAELDIWQADAEGLYSNVHPGIPEWNLRGRVAVDAQGCFEVATIQPPPYEIPQNGPTASLLRAIGRHLYRPAHLHVKVRCAGYIELTSQLYFEGDAYLDNDVANAVRDDLITQLYDGKSSIGPQVSDLTQQANSKCVRYEFALAHLAD